MIDSWMRAHRLSRAIFVAVGLVLLLIWALLNKPAPLVSQATEQAQVISASNHFAVVQLADGRKVRLYFPSPEPRPGASVRLIRETYADGKTLYLLDIEAWQMGASDGHGAAPDGGGHP
jgi:hypothetical protein